MTQSLPPALATLAVLLLGMADARHGFIQKTVKNYLCELSICIYWILATHRYLLVRLPDMGGIMPPPPDIPSPTIMPPPTLLTAATPPPPTAATPHSHMTMAPQPPPVVPTVPPRWVQQYPQYQPPQQYPIDPPYYYDASSYGDGYGEMAWRKGRSKYGSLI